MVFGKFMEVMEVVSVPIYIGSIVHYLYITAQILVYQEHISCSCVLPSSWRSWRSWRSFQSYYILYNTYLLHILISMKAYIPSIGLVAHLQSIDLRSERGGFESRHRHWCLFLGSMHKNAHSFFIN